MNEKYQDDRFKLSYISNKIECKYSNKKAENVKLSKPEYPTM